MATTIEERQRNKGVPGLVAQIPTGGLTAPSAPTPTTLPTAAPLDAQAAGDRQAIGGAFGAIKGLSERAGAAIADVAMLPVRGVAGAYDSAVVRPMRAAGVNAAYVSPMVSPAGADPSSQTPFYDQIRARDAAEGQKVLDRVNAYQAANPNTDPTTGVPRSPSGVTQPNPTDMRLAAGTQVPPSQPAAPVDMGNGIQRINGGSSPLFTNVQGADNAALMARGVPSAQNQGAMAGIQARQDAADAGRAARAQYDAEVAANNPDAKTMLLQQLNGKKLTAKGAGVLSDLARTDATSATAAENSKIAQGRFGIEKAGAQIDQAGKQQLQAAQTAFINAKTPAERVQAESVLRALQQKYEKEIPNRYTVVPGGQSLDPATGQPLREPSQVLDNQTGQFVQPQAAAPKQQSNFQPGQVYKDGKGNKAKWDGAKFVPV